MNTSERSSPPSKELEVQVPLLVQFIKAVLRPFILPFKKFLIEPVRNELHIRMKNEEVFTQGRFEQIKEVVFKISDKQQEIIDYVGITRMREPTQIDCETFISNGLIDVDSYIEKALEGETYNLAFLKNKYGEDGFYYLFEKLFRGSEQEIARRQSFYLQYIKNCFATVSKTNKSGHFLDFGSGRGEFLSLLNSSQIPAIGVDTSRMNCDLSLQKGFKVFCEDGLSFLEKQPDESLFGLTMFQVAEHIDYSALKTIIHLVYKKLMPGGMILIETVNPSCEYAMKYFYLDPTHVRPYPPETLRVCSEWEGFVNMKIIYYTPTNKKWPVEDTTNYVGYALIGYKSN